MDMKTALRKGRLIGGLFFYQFCINADCFGVKSQFICF